jgi:hypothetical protein
MVDISLKKTFQQQEYGLSNLSNGIGNNIEVDLRHAYDASEADFFRPKFSFHVSSPDKVISKANKFGTAERYHALYMLDIIRKKFFFGIIDFFFCILEMHV